MYGGGLTNTNIKQNNKNYRSIIEDDTGSSWDYIMFFPAATKAGEKFNSDVIEDTVSAMHECEFETYLYWSVQHDEVICKIRVPIEVLKKFAEHAGFKILLDEDRLNEAAKVGWDEKNIEPIVLYHEPSITPYRPCQYIYAQYFQDQRLESLYARETSASPHPFSQNLRLKLIPMFLRYAGIDVRGMISSRKLLAFFPLHSPTQCEHLELNWLDWKIVPWKQPHSLIKDYFGEQVGLYFAFLAHYTSWLFPLSIFGFLCFLDQLIEWNIEAKGALAFSVFVAFWSILMLKFWQQKEATLAMMWGTTGFEKEELPRPTFVGKVMKSIVTGKEEMYDPPSSRQKKKIQSQAVIFTLLVIIIAAIIGVFSLKVHLKKFGTTENIKKNSSTIASFINAFQIQVFDTIYTMIAIALTERENHRTDTEYKDNLIAKLFLFKFVNSYASLYYIAFLQKNIEGNCDLNSCMLSLGKNVAIIFLTRIFVGTINQIVIPKIKQKIRIWKETKGTLGEDGQDSQLSAAENEYILEHYDYIMSMISDYSDICVQFGYVSLFVTAFPLAPLFALLSNYFEIRTDGYKLLYTYRRFEPHGAEDIGLWQQIFTLTGAIAVMTNSGLVFFTSTAINARSSIRVWLFFFVILSILMSMTFFSMLAKPVMDEVKIQLERQSYLVKKLVFGQPDRIQDIEQQQKLIKLTNNLDLIESSLSSTTKKKRHFDIFSYDDTK